jgi:hypothetical protein
LSFPASDEERNYPLKTHHHIAPRLIRLEQALLLAVSLSACSGGKSASSAEENPPSAAAPETIVTRPRAGPSSASSCEHTGLWAACSLERRLRQSGFVVKKLDEKPDRNGFSVEPIVYALGSSRLEVFLYDDEKSLAHDLVSLDTVAVAPRGSAQEWPSTPTWIHSANLAAVLLTQNQRQAERVVLAITAGPPQPDSPR